MLIFTDSHKKYLTKAELSNLEKDDHVKLHADDRSLLRSHGGFSDSLDPMRGELAPEYMVPGPVTYIQPQTLVPVGGTDTPWDSTEWFFDTFDTTNQSQTTAGPLALNKFVNKTVSRGSNKASLRGYGYVFHARRATHVYGDLQMNGQSSMQIFDLIVYRTAIIKNAQKVPRNISFFITTNHARWAQGSASIITPTRSSNSQAVQAKGGVRVSNLSQSGKPVAISSLLENGSTVQGSPGQFADDWSANHAPFPNSVGNHQVWNPRHPATGGHGWPVRKHTFTAEKNSSYKLTYAAHINGQCEGKNNSVDIRLNEAPALFVI